MLESGTLLKRFVARKDEVVSQQRFTLGDKSSFGLRTVYSDTAQ
jgi:hypothetical protein